jgi:hypothetical protein
MTVQQLVKLLAQQLLQLTGCTKELDFICFLIRMFPIQNNRISSISLKGMYSPIFTLLRRRHYLVTLRMFELGSETNLN